MSITNKLVANIKQTQVDINKFTDTNNVICIDTSNNRIGINTKTPRYSIDICGTNNKIFVSNLEVAQNASIFSISGTTINCVDGSFTRNLDTSFINFKTISGSLIRATTILGICGAIVDLSGHNIKLSNELIALSISADTIKANSVTTNIYDVETGSFNVINVTRTNTTTTITGGTIVAVSIVANTIDCSTLTANFMQSDRINCVQTLSAGTVSTNNLTSASGEKFFTLSGGLFYLATELGDQNIFNIQTLISGEIARQSNNEVRTALIVADKGIIDDCCINTLTVTTSININGHLILPQQTSGTSYNGYYGSLAIKQFGLINSLTLYNSNSKWSNIFSATHYATLDLRGTSNNNIATYIIDSADSSILPNYRYIPIKFKTINNNAAKTQLFSINSSNKYIEISNTDLSSGIYEINASVTLSYNNTISGDVEPNDFTFGLYDNIILDFTDANISSTIEISYNYVKNKNLILAFDNSYNYSSVSLHYIGPLYYTPNYSVNNTNTRGLCYLVSSQKDISNFNVEYFSSTIKLLNYDT